MKCSACPDFIGKRCIRAESGEVELSEIDDPICLARLQVMLLRDIMCFLEDSYGEE